MNEQESNSNTTQNSRQTKTVQCENCGASNLIEVGKAGKCEYCNSPIGQDDEPEINISNISINTNVRNKNKKAAYGCGCIIIIIAVIFAVIGIVSNIAQRVETQSGTVATLTVDKTVQVLALKDTAAFKELKITADEIVESEGKPYLVPADGKVFIGVKLTFENISDTDQEVSQWYFSTYIDGVKCDYSVTGALSFSNETMISETVSPGKKLVGWYAVETSKDWKELELQVDSSKYNGKKTAFVFKK